MFNKDVFKNIRYYASFQLIFVVLAITLCSIGAFFHFLLGHEISIVESWIHNNNWEIIIISKVLSLYLINKWFKMRLYELLSIRALLKQLVGWPELRALVISVFSLIAFLVLGDVTDSKQNLAYLYYHVISFFGLIVFFGVEFVLLAYLDDVLNHKTIQKKYLGVIYCALFAVSFKLTVPDYYRQLTYVIFCFSTLLYLSGKEFKDWSNVLCYLVVFIAPMGTLFGMDPVWGDDFSPFRLKSQLGITFLAVIWMVSFGYYKYRERFIFGARRLVR